ncbi:hypothetical protein L1049_000265 [Liquidambar formosana]|uniref:Hexosyltransferase n=1 Tax=Liquidambar formosana TaxID=63359 RepID=A0AAP0R2I6_LIQFO
MQLHISPSLRHVTVFPSGKGVREFIKVKVGSRKVSYRMVFYSLLFFTFLLRFVFVLTAMDTIDGESKCSTIGCLGKRLGPRILGRRIESSVPEVIYQVLEEPASKEEIQGASYIPQTLEEFMAEIKQGRSDAKTFAVKLRAMDKNSQNPRIPVPPRGIQQHTKATPLPHSKTSQRALHQCRRPPTAPLRRIRPLPSRQLLLPLRPRLRQRARHLLSSPNLSCTTLFAPEKVVLHIITDRKTYSPMQAWFSLHPLSPAIIEVKGLHHFDWFTKGKVPVLEAMEKDQRVRSQFRGGSSAIVANNTEKPVVIAAKLQALSPKYNSLMNHIRIHLPELFPSLNKVVFLDDDIVIQSDLTPLWDIDMNGKVNGAVETCRGDDKFVMSKRLKSYLNFSHPLIKKNFDPNECALGLWYEHIRP